MVACGGSSVDRGTLSAGEPDDPSQTVAPTTAMSTASVQSGYKADSLALTTAFPVSVTPGPSSVLVTRSAPQLSSEPEVSKKDDARSSPTVVHSSEIETPVSGAPTAAKRGLDVGDVAYDFTLPSVTGPPYSLDSLQGEQNAVLIFYRGFW